MNRPISEKEKARRFRFRHIFMETYYCQRRAWLDQMEAETALYGWEVEEFKERNPPFLFKQYLIDSRGMPR